MKNCLFCKFFQLTYEQDYSDLTPGAGLELGCNKRHWQFDEWEETEKDFRLHMLTAETCPDYEVATD